MAGGDTERVKRADGAFDRFLEKGFRPSSTVPKDLEIDYLVFQTCKSVGQPPEYVENNFTMEEIRLWFNFSNYSNHIQNEMQEYLIEKKKKINA